MPKFFVESDKIDASTIVIDTEDVNHIRKVLRMNIGDKLNVCDSSGWDYEAEITSITEKNIICAIVQKRKSDTEPDLEVVLYQALPKASKMEYIIQKTVELGINKIVPVSTSRCVVKIENKKDGEKKQSRWQKIAESAAKQSGRGIIPEISVPISFDEALEDLAAYDLSFVPYECEENNTVKNELKNISSKKKVSFIVGPEGGFSSLEIEKLKQKGINTVTLGRRILRTETAGEAVLTMIMYEADEFKY